MARLLNAYAVTTLTFHGLGLAGDLILRAVQRDRITKIRPNLDNIAAASCVVRAKVRRVKDREAELAQPDTRNTQRDLVAPGAIPVFVENPVPRICIRVPPAVLPRCAHVRTDTVSPLSPTYMHEQHGIVPAKDRPSALEEVRYPGLDVCNRDSARPFRKQDQRRQSQTLSEHAGSTSRPRVVEKQKQAAGFDPAEIRALWCSVPDAAMRDAEPAWGLHVERGRD